MPLRQRSWMLTRPQQRRRKIFAVTAQSIVLFHYWERSAARAQDRGSSRRFDSEMDCPLVRIQAEGGKTG
jgi:hypothetical protein